MVSHQGALNGDASVRTSSSQETTIGRGSGPTRSPSSPRASVDGHDREQCNVDASPRRRSPVCGGRVLHHVRRVVSHAFRSHLGEEEEVLTGDGNRRLPEGTRIRARLRVEILAPGRSNARARPSLWVLVELPCLYPKKGPPSVDSPIDSPQLGPRRVPSNSARADEWEPSGPVGMRNLLECPQLHGEGWPSRVRPRSGSNPQDHPHSRLAPAGRSAMILPIL